MVNYLRGLKSKFCVDTRKTYSIFYDDIHIWQNIDCEIFINDILQIWIFEDYCFWSIVVLSRCIIMGKIENKFLEMLIFLHLENKCRISKEDINCFLHKIHVFFSLTVLLKPSPPRILPIAPTFTEGTPVNLTCSSIGGSPPPQVIPPTISVTLGKSSDIKRTVARSHCNAPRVRRALDARRASLATVATVCWKSLSPSPRSPRSC